jgi:hypothetical protein
MELYKYSEFISLFEKSEQAENDEWGGGDNGVYCMHYFA